MRELEGLNPLGGIVGESYFAPKKKMPVVEQVAAREGWGFRKGFAWAKRPRD
jgi:hypothetical protein